MLRSCGGATSVAMLIARATLGGALAMPHSGKALLLMMTLMSVSIQLHWNAELTCLPGRGGECEWVGL